MRGLLIVGMVCRATERWHRVVAAFVPGVAARQAGGRKTSAAQHAEARHRLERVLRARGIEAAGGAAPRGHRELVAADRAGDEAPHRGVVSASLRHSAARLSCRARAGTSRARGRTLTTRSHEGSERWCSRNDSRMMRRRRLRATAPPAARTATASPRRGAPKSLAVAITVKYPSFSLRPRA